jgi:hypothetical protein
LANLADVFVNDAFSAAHRAHASTEGVARLLPAYAGRLMEAELKALDAALGNPARPVVAIVGGAKVSTKLELLGNLCSKVDVLVIGGAMANTFLAAQGHGMGKSLQEAEMHETARQILEQAKAANCEILLPVDLVVAEDFRANPPTRTVGETLLIQAVPAKVESVAASPWVSVNVGGLAGVAYRWANWSAVASSATASYANVAREMSGRQLRQRRATLPVPGPASEEMSWTAMVSNVSSKPLTHRA